MFTLADMRKAVDQLRAADRPITLPMRTDIRLSVSGVVIIPGLGWMHPEAFREISGEKAYQWLLSQPRIVTSHDEED